MPRDEALLADIVIYTRKALRDAGRNTRASLGTDDTLQNAMIRYVEVIGEAAGRVSDDLHAAHPEVPWQAMAGMRNRLIHEYNDVDLDELWKTVTEDLPILVAQVEGLLPG